MRNVIVLLAVLLTGLAGAARAESANNPLASAATLRGLRPTAAAPVVRLTYEVTNYRTDNDRGRWTVDLGRDYVAVHDGDRIVVHDFALQRWLQINPAAGTFRNRSMHAEVAFRRTMLNGHYDVLATAEARGMAKQLEISQMGAEASMSLAAPSPPRGQVTVERTIRDGVEIFHHKGEEWTRARYAAERLSGEGRASYARFLRRVLVGLHPAVIGHLLEQDRPVSSLTFRRVVAPGPDRWVTVELVEQRNLSAPHPLEARFRPELGRGVGPRAYSIDKVMAAAATALANPAGARTLGQAQAEIARLQAAGEPFAAWVMLTDAVLQFGQDAVARCREAVCPDLVRLLALQASEPNIALLQQADTLTATNPKQAAALFRRVPRDGLANRHVIDFMQARARELLDGDERLAALPSYVAAIEANPYVASFYKAFGDFLASDGDDFTGWVVLDIARTLPRYPNDSLAEVDAYEAQLRQHHPEQY